MRTLAQSYTDEWRQIAILWLSMSDTPLVSFNFDTTTGSRFAVISSILETYAELYYTGGHLTEIIVFSKVMDTKPSKVATLRAFTRKDASLPTSDVVSEDTPESNPDSMMTSDTDPTSIKVIHRHLHNQDLSHNCRVFMDTLCHVLTDVGYLFDEGRQYTRNA